MNEQQNRAGLAVIAVLGLALGGCGVNADFAQIKERMDERVLRAQVAMDEAIEGPKRLRPAEVEMAEREALEEAEALAQTADDIQAEIDVRLAEERLTRSAAGQAKTSPYAGRPASELSSQLPP